MAKIPAAVDIQYVSGLETFRRGKVRDTYLLPHYPGLLFPLASDRISIFDFVLAALVRQKGEILNALNVFWRTKVFGDLFPHDLVAYGAGIDQFLPEELRGNSELRKRASVINRLAILKFEAIVRGYLAGTSLKPYNESRTVCGHRLPEGLENGSELPFPIFAPTTKAEEGHDEHVTVGSIGARYGTGPERLALQIYCLGRSYALARGIILADTKFEFGNEIRNHRLVVGDEVLTPDACRYWDARSWERRQKGTIPPSLDKQYVRDWGKTIGIDKRDPKVPEDMEWVHQQEVPQYVLETASRIDRYIFWRLTGTKLERFQREEMRIEVKDLPVHVEVVLDSESDMEQAWPALDFLADKAKAGRVTAKLHIISCHHNPQMLRSYAERLQNKNTVVVAAAGKAAALPGQLASWLRSSLKPEIPVLGVGLEGETEKANLAARLSIEELPDEPVALARDGRAYFGGVGMRRAAEDAIEREFYAPLEPLKEAKFDLPLPG